MMEGVRRSRVRLLSSRLRTWRWELWQRRVRKTSLRARLIRRLRKVVLVTAGENSHAD